MALWILDAGHGGEDFGTIGRFKRKESDVTLAAALEARKHLERNGERVILTRSSDELKTIDDRIKIANEEECYFFVSLHMNTNINKNKKGVEVHYINSDEESIRLAKTIKDEVLSGLRSNEVGIFQENDEKYKKLNCRGVVVLGDFLSNEDIEVHFDEKKYGIQVAKACLMMVNKVLLLDPPREPKKMQHRGWRVCIGYYKDYSEAVEELQRLKGEGKIGAYIAPFDGK